MRSRQCMQCGIFIPARKGWRFQATRRSGGYIHDTCLDNYVKHKTEVSKIKKRIREKHNRKKYPERYKKYNEEYYRKNRLKIQNRNYIYYHTHESEERRRQRERYQPKHYYSETDDEFIVKVWPRWKTNNGWII